MRKLLRTWSVPAALLVTVGSGVGSAQTASTCGKTTTFADGKVPTREIHVRLSGNDSSGDGSAAKPFATLRKAMSKLTPGTAIRVHSGTYPGNNYLENASGTATAPIWIGGAPGETPPVFSGGGLGFLLVKVKYLVLHDLAIQWTSGHGINIHDNGETANPTATHSVVFRKLNIHDTGGQCLKMAGLNNFRILDSQFMRCTTVNIDGVGVHNGLIFRSKIGSGQHGIQVKGGSSNVEMRANRITNMTNRGINMGGSSGYTYYRPPLSTSATNYEARDIRAIANIIEDSKAPVAIAGCVNCTVANNTIIDPITWAFRILQETTNSTYRFAPASAGRFLNNIIYYRRSAIASHVNVGPNTASTTFQFRNNLWYAYDNPTLSKPIGLPVAEIGGVYGLHPKFVNPGLGLYPILLTSPAAGAGIQVTGYQALATGDYEGSCWASPPSIGAFEK